MRKIFNKWLAVAFVAILPGCSQKYSFTPVDEFPTDLEYVLPVIETTDLHGHIIKNDGNIIQYALAYIADKANDIREGDFSRLLLLDAGDLYQGASISNLLGGWPVYVSIDKMGYDAVALGNHEFDWELNTLIDSDATLPDYQWNGQQYSNKVPVLCSNIFQNGNRVSCTADYAIVEKSAVSDNGQRIKVRIGIIGFAINYASSIMTSKFSGKGYSINEDYSIANRIASELEESGKCDATVLLIHGKAEYAAEQLGANSAVDLVLGGHSHQTLSGKTDTGIAYLQGGRYSEHYAYSDLVFSYNRNPEGISFNGVRNQRIFDVPENLDGRNESDFDKDIISVCDDAIASTARQMNDVIGYITIGATSYYLDGSGGRVSIMSNWMCDILRRIGEADVAFVNSGGVRTSIPLGGNKRRDITVSDVYEIFPFSNTTYVYKITFGDLLRLFNYSLTSAGSSIFSCMTGIDCHFSGKRVLELRKGGVTIYRNGQWKDGWESRELTLAVSEYLATTDRIDWETNMGNPLLEWNRTSRLLYDSLVDNENAILVLRDEAASSNGHLYLDIVPHFVQVSEK